MKVDLNQLYIRSQTIMTIQKIIISYIVTRLVFFALDMACLDFIL
jgi:hypothetical protein